MSKHLLSAVFISVFILSPFSFGQTPWKTFRPCKVDAKLPEPVQEGSEFRFIAVGDTGNGCSNGDKASPCELVKEMASLHDLAKFKHLFLLGDNVYFSGDPKSFFKKLFTPFVPLSEKGVLIKGVIGNHDAMSKSGVRLQMKLLGAENPAEQTIFFDNVESNDPTPDDVDPKIKSYYSYVANDGLVEFFALDSSMLTGDCCAPFFWRRNYKDGDADKQKDWFFKKLEASKARWRVVLVHHPPYSSGKHHGSQIGSDGAPTRQDEMEKIRAILAEASGKGRIHLVLAGHEHFYERIESSDGTRYFITGSGSKKRENDLEGRLPLYHGCGETGRNTFMLFSVRRETIEFWTLTGAKEIIDHGIVDWRR